MLVTAESWSHLANAVRTRPADLVVADPGADGTIRTEELQSLIARYPTLPVLLYAHMTPESLKATVALSRGGARQVVLKGFDDDADRFLRLIERQPAYVLAEKLMDRLSQPLKAVPPRLARSITSLIDAPLKFNSADDLATAAGTTRRSICRGLAKAGLATPMNFIIGARVLRAYHYMRDPGFMIEDISAKLGYKAPRHLARHVKIGLGMTPSALRRVVGPEEFISLLATRLCSRGKRLIAAEREAA